MGLIQAGRAVDVGAAEGPAFDVKVTSWIPWSAGGALSGTRVPPPDWAAKATGVSPDDTWYSVDGPVTAADFGPDCMAAATPSVPTIPTTAARTNLRMVVGRGIRIVSIPAR